LRTSRRRPSPIGTPLRLPSRGAIARLGLSVCRVDSGTGLRLSVFQKQHKRRQEALGTAPSSTPGVATSGPGPGLWSIYRNLPGTCARCEAEAERAEHGQEQEQERDPRAQRSEEPEPGASLVISNLLPHGRGGNYRAPVWSPGHIVPQGGRQAPTTCPMGRRHACKASEPH
jgi:hypothetical protein